jgi:hypothetical protein
MADIGTPEFKRRRRVVDTMLTAHAILGERYERRARGLTLLIMGLSIVATGVAFISGESNATIGPFTARVQVWVGALTCVIFFLSIVDLLVEWRRRAWGHDEAARRLADLKALYRHARSEQGVTRSDVDLIAEYDHAMDALEALRVRIPDAKFNRLKARHWRKVELSKRISARPQRPLLLHRLDILREGLGAPPTPSGPPVPPTEPPDIPSRAGA